MAFSVRRSLAWMTMSQAGMAILQFGSSLVVARLLTPYEIGVFAVATAIAGVLGVLRTIGLPNYIIRAPTVDRDFLTGVFTVNLIVMSSVAVLVAGLSLLGGTLLGEPGVHHVLLALALVPLLASLEFLPAACIERAGNFRIVALVNLGRTFVATVVTLVAAFHDHSYMSLAYGQVSSAVIAMLAMNVIGRRHASLRLGLYGWRATTRYGLDILGTVGVMTLYSRLSDFLLGWILGLHALGIYSRAAGLLAMLWENFQIIILRVVYVDLVGQKRMGISYRASYLRVFWAATAVLWPAFGGLAVVSGPALRTLYGEQWIAGAPVLSLLCIAAIGGSLILMTWEVFLAAGETRRLVRLQAAQSSFGLAVFALGCFGGIIGAGAARILEATFNVVLYRRHLARLTETTLADVLPAMRQGFTLMALAITPAALVMAWHGWSPEAPLVHVLPAVAVGMAAWAGGLRLLDHPLYKELRSLAASVLGGKLPRPTP